MADLIERKAVIAAIADEPFINDSTKAVFRNIVNKVPTITPESLVRHAKWLEYEGEDAGFHFCSNCKKQAFNYEENREVIEVLPDYCPHCGARMDEVSDAPKKETIQYNWPDTGKLEVAVKSPNMATMRFTPSEGAVRAGAEGSEHMRKICEHQRAFLAKMKELEAQGYYSGGWDEKTDKTAISKDGKIVGYMDRDLNIEWR